MNEITLSELQREVGEWSHRNFPNSKPHHPLLGAVEEAGELGEACGSEADPHLAELLKALSRLSHAHLKREQGIRGTPEEHDAAKVDAVADTVIYLADYCARNQISLSYAVTRTWGKVRTRDWQKNKVNGGVEM